ncbi:MAG TPA: glycosyltransferase family 4 protein [Anaerolineaceae bacterium]|nr:glycosyltransferase family 4 protein [Anaerolineaceae bacterium]
MSNPEIVILHYSVSPIIGGVELVIEAHAREMIAAGYPVTLLAGRGEQDALPEGAHLVKLPLLDSQNEAILSLNDQLEKGQVSETFDAITERIQHALDEVIAPASRVIVHNVLTKHFNLPLTAALHRLIDARPNQKWIAWCHDFSWTSSRSRETLHDGYPWDLLRTYRRDVRYVTVSDARRAELAHLLACPPKKIAVVYNGVDPEELLGLSHNIALLVDRLHLLSSDLILLMPVRVTHAKNVEFALEVTRDLVEQGVHAQLIVVGPPDPHDESSMAYFRSLQAMRDRLGLHQQAHFIYEISSPDSQPTILSNSEVGELYRLSDGIFMPSISEGFGIPVLEGGLTGVRVFTTPIPASVEIGQEDVVMLELSEGARNTAQKIIEWSKNDATYQLRRNVRQNYTWHSIFQKSIQPLL